MWINTALNQQTTTELPHVAKVISIEGGRISAQSHLQTINLPVMSPIGMTAMPQVGDEVVLLPNMDGSYYCVGQLSTGIAGEVRLSSPSGAEIALRADGSISLNGMIISKGGVVVGNTTA